MIVEVRARRGGALVRASESIDARKQRRIVRAARHLLMSRPAWRERPVRFDVVAIDGIEADEPEIEWIRAAFDAA
ncbi:MAG: YraN family protein [Gammaproteobacteria bacterium]